MDRAFTEALRRSGAGRVFVVAPPVASGAPLADAVRTAGLEPVEVASPDAAILIAAVTGELEGRPGVALVRAADVGRARDALAYARLDRAPVVVLAVDDCPGRPARPLFKAAMAAQAADAGGAFEQAWAMAARDPRGPVRLDVPDVAASSPRESDAAAPPRATLIAPAAGAAVDRAALEAAVSAITSAERPVVIAGLGCLRGDSAAWLRPFVESLPAPAWVTAKAKGVLPDPHPLAFGVLSRVAPAPALLARADLVIAVGLDSAEAGRELWPRGAAVVELAPVGASSRERGPDTVVAGEVGLVLAELAPRIRGACRSDWDVAELDRVKRAAAPPPRGGALDPFAVARLVREMTPAGTVAAVDPGPHVDGVIRGWHAVAPLQFLTPTVVAPPGFAVAAAVAARLTRPGSLAVCFTTGEALAGATPALELAARKHLGITIVVFGPAPPAALAAARSFSVGTARELPAVLPVVLAAHGPAVLEVRPV